MSNHGHSESGLTQLTLQELFGAPISPKWEFVLIGSRLFGRLDKDTWHEYESER